MFGFLWFITQHIGGFYTVYRKWDNNLSIGSGYSNPLRTLEEARTLSQEIMNPESTQNTLFSRNPHTIEIYYIPYWGKQQLVETVKRRD
jgi:hypothetical protein